jgi:CheY-like chemotaxis protein
LKLLIVEDEPFIAADLESLAADLGHEVVGVADCQGSALSMAHALSPDAALIDIKLRDGFTGPQIAQALIPELAVAFVSGNTELLPPGAFGAIAVVKKPFTDQQIGALLTRLAGGTSDRLA